MRPYELRLIASAAQKRAALWLAQERLRRAIGPDGDTTSKKAQKSLETFQNAYMASKGAV